MYFWFTFAFWSDVSESLDIVMIVMAYVFCFVFLLQQVPKPERKKRRKKDTDIVSLSVFPLLFIFMHKVHDNAHDRRKTKLYFNSQSSPPQFSL